MDSECGYVWGERNLNGTKGGVRMVMSQNVIFRLELQLRFPYGKTDFCMMHCHLHCFFGTLAVPQLPIAI